jgi:stearoyl-CoA desaturase (delta-9 desaturase)
METTNPNPEILPENLATLTLSVVPEIAGPAKKATRAPLIAAGAAVSNANPTPWYFGAKLYFSLIAIAWTMCFLVLPDAIGPRGFLPNAFVSHPVLKLAAIFVLMSHLTISAMSICFHRSHTHQSVKLHWTVDYAMQMWLWSVTSMSKLDWVSVHVYHHAHSDTPNDPHSPAQKGLLNVFFLGVVDYARAKTLPEVLKIRARLKTSKLETFVAEHLFLGPFLLTVALIFAFGPLFGSMIGVLNFAISPLFAVGGVNAIAHSIGYKNYDSKDESRNIGFLVFLNWIIAGELDHNNHHKFPKSPTFAHRWFEFDIGWVYISAMRLVKLSRVTGTIPDFHKHKISQKPVSRVAIAS